MTPYRRRHLKIVARVVAALVPSGTFGAGDGQFDTPLGIAIDGMGYGIVADENNLRVQIFSPGS